MIVKSSEDALVYFDGKSDIIIKVPDTFKTGPDHELLGLCGSYDDDKSNDFADLTGTLYNDINSFAKTWQADLTCVRDPKPPGPCFSPDNNLAAAYDEAERRCSLIEGPTFSPCHKFLPFKPYKEMCMSDVCACNYTARDDCVCDALALYSRMCAVKYNVTLSWRSSFVCRK